MVAVGIGLYFFFDHVERDGMRIRIHVVVALIYNFLGKWGVLAFFGGIGALTALFGIKGLVAGKSSSK